MRRWFRLASLGFVFVLLFSGAGGPKVFAQEGGGIIPPGTFGKADPPGDNTVHYSTNRQDEPWVALNPNDAQNLAMGFNDWSGNSCTDTTPSDCRATPGVSLSGFVRSTNAGSSLTYDCRGRVTLSTAPGGPFAFGDPAVAFGRQNVVYYGTIGFPGTSPSDLTNGDFFIAKSTDRGCTYPTAKNVSGNVKFDDKPSTAVDVNTNSSCVDNVYGAWTELGKNGRPQPDKIMFARSTNGGQTYEIKQLSPASKFRSGAAVKVGRDGTVYVVWLDTREKGAVLTMAISSPPDCGQTFKKNITVATVNLVDGPYPGASFRVNSFPSLATDPSDENTLYVAWADRNSGHTVIKVAKSSTKGQTWSNPAVVAGDVTSFGNSGLPASAFFPALDVDPAGNVNLAFLALEDKPAGTAPGKDVVHYLMFVRQSKNSPPGTAGATWSDPLSGRGFGKVPSGDDPDASSTEDLTKQFLGDYISAVSVPFSTGLRRFLVAWTNSSSASTCDAVDAFRAGTGSKPNVIAQCPLSFGNTDILLTRGFTYTP